MSRKAGLAWEKQARLYLERQGLTSLANNYLCPMGEIDLIMQDRDTVVFVEVRYRKQADFGEGVETIQTLKQRRIIKAAWKFLMEYDLMDKVHARFDVIGIDDDATVNWIQNAIEVQY